MLEAVTHAENVRRATILRTHCRHGHEYTEENTYRYPDGRQCKTCTRRLNQEYRAKKKPSQEGVIT